ncbi:MAG: hypothetical protein IJS50_04000 [Desulfovibrio sp.]|nr:hypothetical protein [Desulfovibrio sp.]
MRLLPFLALVLCLLLPACGGDEQAQHQKLIGIVDLEQIMRESAPALAAQKHVAAVRDILQKGINDLEKEWQNAPEAERNAAMSEGVGALQRQMLKEEQAANQVVLKLLREECEKWRASKKAVFVTAKQELLATDSASDITSEIIEALSKRVPSFQALPSVSVKKRETKNQEKTKYSQNFTWLGRVKVSKLAQVQSASVFSNKVKSPSMGSSQGRAFY